MNSLQLFTFLSSTCVAAAMVFLGQNASLLERRRSSRCAACGRLRERGRLCECGA